MTILLGTPGDDNLTASSFDSLYVSAGNDTIVAANGAQTLFLSLSFSFGYEPWSQGLARTGPVRIIAADNTRISDSAGQFSVLLPSHSISKSFSFSFSDSKIGDTNIIDLSGLGGIQVYLASGLGKIHFKAPVSAFSPSSVISIAEGNYEIDGSATGKDQLFYSGAGVTVIADSDDGTHLASSVTSALVHDVDVFSISSHSYEGSAGVIDARNTQRTLYASIEKGGIVIGGSGDDVIRSYHSTHPSGVTSFTGGLGSDLFGFQAANAGELAAAIDKTRITDLSGEDSIDLRLHSAYSQFTPAFIGSKAFTGSAGELRFTYSGPSTLLQLDVDGDKVADGILTISNGAFKIAETQAGSGVYYKVDANKVAVGTESDDHFNGGSGNDQLQGFGGNDFLSGGRGADMIAGGAGNDTIFGGEGNDNIAGGDGNDLVQGDDGHDSLNGGKGDDTVVGNAGNDIITGDYGRDALNGGDGNDVLNGGAGADLLSGGAGADIFRFFALTDSSPGVARDTMLDFKHAEGDIIDLKAIDANRNIDGNQDFFLGGHVFSHKAGELIQVYQGTYLTLRGDVNGDGVADFALLFQQHVPTWLVASDFVL